MGSAYMLGAGGSPFNAEWSSFPWYENAILIVLLALPNFMGAGTIVAGTRQHLGLRLTQIGAVFSSVFLLPLAAVGAFSPGGRGISELRLYAALADRESPAEPSRLPSMPIGPVRFS